MGQQLGGSGLLSPLSQSQWARSHRDSHSFQCPWGAAKGTCKSEPKRGHISHHFRLQIGTGKCHRSARVCGIQSRETPLAARLPPCSVAVCLGDLVESWGDGSWRHPALWLPLTLRGERGASPQGHCPPHGGGEAGQEGPRGRASSGLHPCPASLLLMLQSKRFL